MKHITQEDILGYERLFRTNLINSLSGYKPVHLVGTVSASGVGNLALFSSVFHIGANPPLLGMIMRPPATDRHTLPNIRESGFYTLNHVHAGFIDRAHYTSARFDAGISEFEATGLTAQFLDDFRAPYVGESQIKMGMRLVEEIPIPANGTLLLVGEVLHLYLPEQIVDKRGMADLGAVDDVAVAGLHTYYSGVRLGEFPYARPGEFPVSE